MSTTDEPIQIPPTAQIRERLAATVAEARALRRLLKLAEAACRAKEASTRQLNVDRRSGKAGER
jgi:hypothetical protein